MVFEINNKQNISQLAQTTSAGGAASSNANNTRQTIFDSQTNAAQSSNGTKTVPDSNEIKKGTQDFDELVDKLKIPETDTKLDPDKIKSIHTDENNNIVVKYTTDDGSEVQYTFAQKPDSAVKTESGQKPSAEYKPVEKRTTKEGIEEITKYNDDKSKVVTKGARSTTFDSNNRITNVKTDKGFGISTETSYEYSGSSNIPTKQVITGTNGQKSEITKDIKNPNEKKDENPVSDTPIQNDNDKKDTKEQHLYPKQNETFQQTAERLGLKEGTKEYEAFQKANPDALAENKFPQGQKVNIPDELKDIVKVDGDKTEQIKPNEGTGLPEKADSESTDKPATQSDKPASGKPAQTPEKETAAAEKPSQTASSQSAVSSDSNTGKPAQAEPSQTPAQVTPSAEQTPAEAPQPVPSAEPTTEPVQIQNPEPVPQSGPLAEEPVLSETPQPQAAPVSAENNPVPKPENQDNIQNAQNNEPVKQTASDNELSREENPGINDSKISSESVSEEESKPEQASNPVTDSIKDSPNTVKENSPDTPAKQPEQVQSPDNVSTASASQPVKTENDVQQEIQTNPLAGNNNPQSATPVLVNNSAPVSDSKVKVNVNSAESIVSPDKTAVQSGQAAQVHVGQRVNNTTPQGQTSRSDTLKRPSKPSSQLVDSDNSVMADIEGINPDSAIPRVEGVAEVRSGYVGQKADSDAGSKHDTKAEPMTASVPQSSSSDVKPDTVQTAPVAENNAPVRENEQKPASEEQKVVQNNDTKKEEKIIQHKNAENEAVQKFENSVTEDIQNKTVTQSKSALTQNQMGAKVTVNIPQATKGVVGSVQTVNPPNNSSNTGTDNGSRNNNGSNQESRNKREQQNSEAEDLS